MKFRITVKNRGEAQTWPEQYDEPQVKTVQEAQAWAMNTINGYNATLRPKEKARELVDVEILGEGEVHDWHKTNSFTRTDHRGNFDEMRCEACGVTGRRYGLGAGGIKRSPMYIAKKFEKCDVVNAQQQRAKKS